MLSDPLFLGSEIYRRSSFGPWHPLRVPRVSTVMDLSRALGWLPASQYRNSPRAKPAALSIWHDSDYLTALQQAEARQTVSDEHRQRFGLGTSSNPVFPEMFRRPATGAGAVMFAAEMLRDGGVIYCPAGGTHHGMPARANGFCFLNDPVMGILTLRRMGVRRIAYVDIDAHHPDGVEEAFRKDPDVLMLSVHEEKRWPFTGAIEDRGLGNLYNLPVPRDFNDSEMDKVLQQLLLPVLERFKPEAIVLQCGADALEEDPLSRLALSNNALWSVVSTLRPIAPRYLVLGGGGYNPWSVGRAWTGVWAILNDIEIPDTLPIEAEEILRNISWSGHSRAKSPPDTLFTTLRDAPRPGPVRQEVLDRIKRVLARAL